MKIKRIQINNYRAFLVKNEIEGARYTIDLPTGGNLLVYGENGSGKSSLYKGMKDFLSSAVTTVAFQKNLFYDPAKHSEQPYISVTLDDDTEHYFSAEAAKTNTYLTPVLAQTGLTKGFISYRDLLKLHFCPDNQSPDLFSLFLGEEGLFSGMTVPMPVNPSNKISFGDLWKRIKATLDNDALFDYNTNADTQFKELEGKANHLLKYFHKDCNFEISYSDAIISDDVITPPIISFKVTLFGKELPEHEDVLNEARLTSLAISVYLAHLFIIPDSGLNILFLDDIFIGLDMTNRIPLIKILTDADLFGGKSFARDYQIFLTTYDREWFNVAKTYMDDNWNKVEFYVDSHSCEKERPLIRKSGTYKERALFYLIDGDYPACANYLRKAFEQELKRIIPENVLYPGFNTVSGSNSIIALSKKHFTITENDDTWFYKLKGTEDDSIQTFRFISLQQMISQFKRLVNQYDIPFAFTHELNAIKDRLLNPLSHDDLTSSIFKTDLITGFDILEELEKIESKIVLEIKDSFIQLYCLKKDYNNDEYYYRFELNENLRVIKYGSFKVLLNANCHSHFRTRRYNFCKFEVMENNYTSLKKLCKAVFYKSVAEGEKYSFYDDFMFNEVYTETGQTLNTLL